MSVSAARLASCWKILLWATISLSDTACAARVAVEDVELLPRHSQ